MYKILTSNFKTQNSQEIRQLVLLNLLLSLALLFSVAFGIFNFLLDSNIFTIALNVLGIFLAVTLLLDLHINQNLQRSTSITISAITIYFLVFTIFNKNDGYGLFWISVVPVFIVGLVGAKRSTIYLVPYFSIIFFLAYFGIGEWQNGQWNFIGFVRLFASSLLTTLIVIMMDLALMQSYENYEKLSSIDILTNICNRRKTQEILHTQIQRAHYYDEDLALILFDIDDFKKINDKLGHKVGDLVLQTLAKEIRNSLRNSDFFGRWGGEEFLIVIPQTTQSDALHIAEKIRLLISTISCKDVENLSCSFGVTIFKKDKDSQDIFIDRADKAMYKAKEMGKNCVEFL